MERGVTLLQVALLALLGCSTGDIGSSDSDTTSANTVQNGISDCTYECQPVSNTQWIVTVRCSGQIQDGPNLINANNLPEGCTSGEESVSNEEAAPTT